MSVIAQALRSSLRAHLSAISIDSLIQRHVARPNAPVHGLSLSERKEIAERLTASARLFSTSDPQILASEIRAALALEDTEPDPKSGGGRAPRVQLIQIRTELDVSVARNEARRMVMETGIIGALPVKVATVVSELARNIVLYALPGSLSIETSEEQGLPVVRITARDEGPGIAPSQLETMFAGTYRSKSGLGKGLAAVKRVASEFKISTAPGKGTLVQVVFRGAT